MSLNPEQALRIMQEHQHHCLASHGAMVCATCDTCKRFMLEFMDALGMDPNTVYQLENTYGIPEQFKDAAAFFARMFPKQQVSAWD
mgnify:CR=1 FL=1